jgi:hypothetical protein
MYIWELAHKKLKNNPNESLKLLIFVRAGTTHIGYFCLSGRYFSFLNLNISIHDEKTLFVCGSDEHNLVCCECAEE